MVQIAAVSHSEDANVLVNALRKHGYAATRAAMPDGLIHVRIGPFATREEATGWREAAGRRIQRDRAAVSVTATRHSGP